MAIMVSDDHSNLHDVGGGSIFGRDLFTAEIGWVDAPVRRLIQALNTLVNDEHRRMVDDFLADFESSYSI